MSLTLPASIDALADALGRRPHHENGKPALRAACPLCGGSPRSTKLLVTEEDGLRLRAHCFACEASGRDLLAALGVDQDRDRWTLPVYINRRAVRATNPQKGPEIPAAPEIAAPPLPALTGEDATEYQAGIKTGAGGRVQYQNRDGRRCRHVRSQGKRVRNPGMTGPGWQPRQWDPPCAPVAGVGAIIIAEGEKDAAAIAGLGYHAFSIPGGSGRAKSCDWTPVASAAAATGLPVLIAPDNDAPGRKCGLAAVAALDQLGVTAFVLDVRDLADGDSPADDPASLPARVVAALDTREYLQPWRRPAELHCTNRKWWGGRTVEGRNHGWNPCNQCDNCREADRQAHIARTQKGFPAVQIVYGAIPGATTPDTATTAHGLRSKTVRRWRDRTPSDPAEVVPESESPTSARFDVRTAISIGDDYRAALATWIRGPVEPRHIEDARAWAAAHGLTCQVTENPRPEQIAAAAPRIRPGGNPLSIEGTDGHRVHVWTASNGWPQYDTDPTRYDVAGRHPIPGLASAHPESYPYNPDRPATAATRADRRHWFERRTAQDVADWFVGMEAGSISPSVRDAILAAPNRADALAATRSVEDYTGPRALLVDAVNALVNPLAWRRCFRPVWAAMGLTAYPDPVVPRARVCVACWEVFLPGAPGQAACRDCLGDAPAALSDRKAPEIPFTETRGLVADAIMSPSPAVCPDCCGEYLGDRCGRCALEAVELAGYV